MKFKILMLILIFIFVGCKKDEIPITQENPTIEISKEEFLVEKLNNMSLEEKVGQIFMLEFRNNNDGNIININEHIISILNDYNVGGIILFGENFKTKEQVKTFISDLQKNSKIK